MDTYDLNFNNQNTNNNTNRILQQNFLKKSKVKTDFIDDLLNDYKEDTINKSKNTQKITRVNIDSRNRIINPKNILDNNIFYINNSLSFTKDSPIMTIKCKDHNLTNFDKIIIQNVKSHIFKIKGNIQIKNKSQYIKILYDNHGINSYDMNYNNLNIEISGIVGNIRNNSYINNVPISVLNKVHKLYLTTNIDKLGSSNYFYIKIDLIPNADYDDTISDITIVFKNISGIPLNTINCNYPLNINQINGYKDVYNVIDSNTISVKLDSLASKNIENVGGNGLYIAKIVNYEEGYPKPNNYKIFLAKSFQNVKKIKLISSEFPNTEKVIKDSPEIRKNNKIYWQNLDDGEKIYEIEITPGNYTPESLVDEIKEKFEKVKRLSYTDSFIIDDGVNSRLEKGEFHKVSVSINSFTDIVEIKSYNLSTLFKAISKVNVEYDDKHIRIKVNHVAHNLSVGDDIVIENAVATTFIPGTILNTSHIIESIQDENNYIIKLPLFNESTRDVNTGGGSAIFILIPIKFRLFFDRGDTPGKLLGFRHVGERNAITPFSYVIANNVAYENDFFQDSVGEQISNSDNMQVQNNVITLSGEQYILMSCNIFKDNESISSNNVSNLFAKILLSDIPGNILFNQHIQLAETLTKYVPTINSLEFSFYSPDGELFDFNGIEHSFTLEFYEDITFMDSQDISTKTGVSDHIIEYLKTNNITEENS